MADSARVLYLTDLDGTLLGDDLTVSPASAAILNDLIAAGVLITAATARARESARRALAGVDLRLPVAFLNGGYLADLHGGPIQGGFPLPAETAAALIEDYLRRDLHPRVYTVDAAGEEHVYHQGTFNPCEQEHLIERLAGGDRRFRRVADLTAACAETIVAVNAVDTAGRLQAMHEAWRGRADVHCHYSPDIYVLGYHWLEICERRAHKGEAARALMALTGADRLVCFGDNTNDLPMFAAADEGYAVGNAHPEVRAAATAVLGDHTTDAVARRIRALADLAAPTAERPVRSVGSERSGRPEPTPAEA